MVIQFIKSSYAKFKSALSRARSVLGTKLQSLFQGQMDENTLEQLEQLLYEADFGVQTSMELTNKIRDLYQANPQFKTQDYLNALRVEILTLLNRQSPQLKTTTDKPEIFMIIGVNGHGKTTSTAKLAYLLSQNGQKVLIAAADTFRAAAIEQLETWAQRLNVDIVKGAPRSDPSSVAFDAIQAGRARECDVVIIDTAGRLHTKIPLMQELEKMRRSCHKAMPQAPHEIFLVLDATTGQNAIDQAKHFNRVTPLTGLILTKLDGTAKGGIVVAIQREIGVPVKFIGTGENLEDLQPFDSEAFVNNLFE